MRNDEPNDLKQIIIKYEIAKSEGKICYLDSESYMDIVEHFCRVNRYSAALEAVDAGLAVHPDCNDLKIIKVNALICTKQFDKARLLLDSLDPESDIDILFFRGELQIALNQDFDGAEKYFRQWIDTDEKNLDLSNEDDRLCFKDDFLQVLASVYELKHWMYNPASMIQRWVKLYIEKCSPLTGDEKDMDMARICHDEMMLSEEIKMYTAFLDNNPYLDGGWTYLATLYNSLGDTEETLNAAEFALAVNPDDISAMVLKGSCLQNRNNFVEAEKLFRKYIEVTYDPFVGVSLAECLISQGKIDEANDHLKMAEKKLTTRYMDKLLQLEIRKSISKAYYMAGMYKDALRLTNLVLKYDSLSVEFIIQKANILLKTGKVNSAIKEFHKAIVMSGESFDTIQSVALYLYNQKQWELAGLFFKGIIDKQLSPNYVHCYAKLAMCCLKTGDYEGFLENLQLACNLCEDDVQLTWWNELEDENIDPADYYSFLKRKFVDDRPELL